MGLRTDPMGGGQFKQMVKSIIEAERQPVKNIEARKGREEAKMKLFQEFKGKFTGLDKVLSDLRGFKKFRELKADLGNGADLMGVTLDKEKAEVGSYEVEIDHMALRSSILSNKFESPDDKVLGIGFIVMHLANGDTEELFVNEKNSSLRNVANLINTSANSPVQASVVRDEYDNEKPWRLIVTAKQDGLERGVEFPDFYFLNGNDDFYIDDSRDSRNAAMKLDGFDLEAAGNEVPDFLTGVNINIKQSRPDQPFMLKIMPDYPKIAGKVKAMIDQTNQILEFINKQNSIDADSDTRSTFAGDSGLQQIEYKIRNMFHSPYAVTDSEGEIIREYQPSTLGIQFERNGMITFKEDKFTKTLEKDFLGVAEAIAGPNGLASRYYDYLQAYTRTGDGLLIMREGGLKQRIKELDNTIQNRERHLAKRQESLVAQFSKLEGTLANLQQQQAYVSASLGGGGGGNLVGQLIGSM